MAATAQILPLGSTRQRQAPVLNRNLLARNTWTNADLTESDWHVELSKPALAELDTAAVALEGYRGPVEALLPRDFQLSATAETLACVRDCLDRGVGFAILERLPVERWDPQTSRAVAWLLVNLLGPVVMQKLTGTRIYDVRDTGKTIAHGVRRSVTNLEQEFHTDGPWLPLTPEVIALVCLKQAAQGGRSQVASLTAAHNHLQNKAPELLARLYQPFWWDRQAEHAANEEPCSQHPVFAWDGIKLTTRYYDDYIRNGHRLMKDSLDADGVAALAAMRAVVELPEHNFEFRLEPGQIEFANNHLVAHSRSAFRDPNASKGRHLLRLWLRHDGGIELEPDNTLADT